MLCYDDVILGQTLVIGHQRWVFFIPLCSIIIYWERSYSTPTDSAGKLLMTSQTDIMQLHSLYSNDQCVISKVFSTNIFLLRRVFLLPQYLITHITGLSDIITPKTPQRKQVGSVFYQLIFSARKYINKCYVAKGYAHPRSTFVFCYVLFHKYQEQGKQYNIVQKTINRS